MTCPKTGDTVFTCTADAATVTCWVVSPTSRLDVHVADLVGEHDDVLNIFLEAGCLH